MFIEDELKEKADTYFNFKHKHMGHALGIEFQHVARNKVIASMPVNENSVQPFGVLHGGASVALAETLCSVGGWFLLDDMEQTVVGVEINANHIRSVKLGGKVTGTAKPIHTGRKIQVWECEIKNEKEKLVCSSRCTLAVIRR
ncbi:PaaI family thioesterase [Gracilimonas tropica]|uniref:PaaI family thioesterase n=1 Tax=Gracilimonas tropica TaxID=454600 RepID=UPI00035CE138|nr:hotdog fold thioesterase [Gracilimonas tropica]